MADCTIVFAADHAAFKLKKELLNIAKLSNYDVLDVGTFDEYSVDYPDFGHQAAKVIQNGRADFAIICCGTGIGIAIVANRHVGVRAAVCHNVETARLSRAHNDANVMALGSRVLGLDEAKDCMEIFLNTPFEGDRHLRRVKKIELI